MRRVYSIVRAALAIIGACLLIIVFTPAVQWITLPLTCPWTSATTGTLILLSGPSNTFSGNPPTLVIGDSTYWRAMDAVYIWRYGRFQSIVVSGDGVEQTVKPLLIANGVPAAAIVVENAATTTHDNVLFTKPLLTGLARPYVLVTSDYHMYRASHCFARAGVQVETLPAPDILKRTNSALLRWDCFWAVAQEYAKIAWYRTRGWM